MYNSDEDEAKLGEETLAAFFNQFEKDIYTKLVLEVLFEELCRKRENKKPTQNQ
jgi:hypothetical protein